MKIFILLCFIMIWTIPVKASESWNMVWELVNQNTKIKTNFETTFEKRVDNFASFGPYIRKGKSLPFNFFVESIKDDDIKVIIEAHNFNKIMLFNIKNQRSMSFYYLDQNYFLNLLSLKSN